MMNTLKYCSNIEDLSNPTNIQILSVAEIGNYLSEDVEKFVEDWDPDEETDKYLCILSDSHIHVYSYLMDHEESLATDICTLVNTIFVHPLHTEKITHNTSVTSFNLFGTNY